MKSNDIISCALLQVKICLNQSDKIKWLNILTNRLT